MDQKDGGEKPQPRPPGLPRMATLTPVEPRPAPHAGPGGEPMCIECGDQQADVLCEMCEDVYCEICFQAQHRKGNRFKHTIKELPTGKNALRSTLPPAPEEDKKEDVPAPVAAVAAPADEAADREALAQLLQEVALDTIVANPSAEWMRDRSKFVPLRLSDDERQLLLLLEAALNVSEYTDNIDIYMFRGKEERMCKELTEVCSLITGMAMCNDWKQGKKLVKVGDFHNNAEFFQHVFEVGRRHKIRNPEKMRASYGKLLHLLQDAQDRDVQREMKFSMVKPIRTVYEFLDEQKHLGLLADPLVPIACAEIVTEDRSRADIEKAAQAKRMAIKILQDHYSKQGLSRDAVSLCLLSIGDNHSFLRANQGPVDQMLQLLTQLYHPDKSTKGTDLTLRYGIKGSCLSHDHRTQYHFVLQSLTLWRDILHDMFRLWYLSETDMLDEQNQYRLRNTGQGLNRMQRCPRIADAMSKIVGGAHRKQGNWVGLSVVHLGDVDVPNALVFIDKYNQVPRILTPIVQAIRGLDALYEQPETKEYIESFGGVGAARLRILTDFFKHGFDGSGSDGGSCIDGRLTSAWNWCSKIAKKEYYPLFLLTGFIGFDGTGF